MSLARLTIFLAVVTAISASAIPAAAQKDRPVTLWSFLSPKQGIHNLYDGIANKRGDHPNLERKKNSPVPDRLKAKWKLEGEGGPLMQKAAEIKQQEDWAQDKKKAAKYLAAMGCGCYDKDGSVTAALLAGLDDCTEEVRLTTVEAIGEASAGGKCEYCNQQCCKGDITKKLTEMAYEQDDKGCWKEPSSRVREAAQRALQYCTPVEADTPDRDQPDPGLQPDAGENGPVALQVGVVQLIDVQSAVAVVRMENQIRLPNGTELAVFQRRGEQYRRIGALSVIESDLGVVAASASNGTDLRAIRIGDGVLANHQPPISDSPQVDRTVLTSRQQQVASDGTPSEAIATPPAFSPRFRRGVHSEPSEGVFPIGTEQPETPGAPSSKLEFSVKNASDQQAQYTAHVASPVGFRTLPLANPVVRRIAAPGHTRPSNNLVPQREVFPAVKRIPMP